MENYNEFRKITNRVPYSTIVIDYSDISSVVKKKGDFGRVIDKKVAEFEKEGIVTSSSLDYFENLVDEYINQLFAILENEHVNCKNTIGYLFRKRASDKIEFTNLLESLKAEISDATEEYKSVKKIYEKFNPISNGHLLGEKSKGSSAQEEENE